MFEPKEIFAGEIHLLPNMKALCEKEQSFAYSWFADYEILGCGGAYQVWPGVWDVWTWLSNAIHKLPITFTRHVRIGLDYHKEKANIHRYQAYIRGCDIRAERWAKALGFETEGKLKQYSTDRIDYLVMGRF